MSSTKGKWNRS